MTTLERVGGGPEGKPHSTRSGRIAAGVRKIKRGAKSWNKKDFKGSDEVRALLKGLRPKKPSTHGKDIPTMAAQGGRAGFFGGGITKISKILKQIKKGVVDRNVKSKEVKKLLEKSKARSKEKAGWGAHLKRRSRVFKEGQAKHKALDIKEGKKKKYIKRDPHEGVPSQSSDWPYWRGDE